jgi:hypothetical protein
MQIKKVKSANLKQSPIRHETLPSELIKRIKEYKRVLGAVEKTSLEETIENFKRDLFPEEELRFWEKIARHYGFLVTKAEVKSPEAKEAVFKTIFKIAMGVD